MSEQGKGVAPPMDGTPFYALVRVPMRWLPYKPNSEQWKRGIAGRWQEMGEYGGWENCRAPNLASWEHHPDHVPADGGEAVQLGNSGTTQKDSSHDQ